MAALLEQPEEPAPGAELVAIQPLGKAPPLFLVHGMAGGMLWGYANLARHLGAEQPVYAFKSRGLEGEEEFATIEAMAAHYVGVLRRFRPQGPYSLGGYCFGGNVAFEMARQLQAAGQEVRLLALFNSSPPNSRFSRLTWTPGQTVKFFYNLLLWAADFRKWKPGDRREFFHWKLRMFKLRLFRGRPAAPANTAEVDPDKLVDLRAFPEEQRRLLAAHVRALVGYHGQPYAGRIHLFRSRGYPLFCSFDRHYGWTEYAAGGVELRLLQGKHDSILDEPCVATLARKMEECLDQPSTKRGPP
jgi:thioesterase domain-containing protein